MASVNDEPFLNLLLQHIIQQGGRRVILATGYKSQDIEAYYRKNNFGLTIEFSKETEPLGTGGAIKNTQALIQSDTFFAMNGDVFCPVAYERLIQFHKRKNAVATLVVQPVKESRDFGVITLNARQEIMAFQEKIAQKNSFINVGTYCFQKDIFSLMPQAKAFSIEYDFFPTLVGKKIFGFEVKEKFIDMGTPQRYEQVQEIFRKR